MRNASILILILFMSAACQRTSNSDLLLGTWRMMQMEIIEPARADTDFRFMVEEGNMMGLYFGINGLVFSKEGEAILLRDGLDFFGDFNVGYRLVDKHSNPDANGTVIEIIFPEVVPEYYEVLRPPGPFRILEITSQELVITDLNEETHAITKGNLALRFSKRD